MLKPLHDFFILKGEYPLSKDTSLVKMYAAGGNLQSQISGTGDAEGYLNFVAVASEGGGDTGTTLQARQTAYKDKRLDNTPDLFEAL